MRTESDARVLLHPRLVEIQKLIRWSLELEVRAVAAAHYGHVGLLRGARAMLRTRPIPTSEDIAYLERRCNEAEAAL